MNNEPAVDIELATELALTVRLQKFFPRRDPRALAAVADVIRQLCYSPGEAQTLVDAIKETAEQWHSVAAFRRLAAGILAEMRGQTTAAPAAAIQPHCQRCRLADQQKPGQRAGLITWAEANCPDCPLLPTARLLQAEAQKDQAARQQLENLPAAERQEMRQRIEQLVKRHGERQNASMAHTEPFLSANVDRLMLAEMRARNEGRSLQWIIR